MTILKKYNKTQNDKNEVLQFIEYNANTRSAWGRGVLAYAQDLMKNLPNDWEYSSASLLEKELLNGASNWEEYSRGGCSLIYNQDICERLSTPSEQKKTLNGERKPNKCEDWLDCQARALYQAFCLIRSTCVDLAD